MQHPLYSTLLYSTLLYSTLLYFTLLYSTLLYSTLLYSTLLYSILLYSILYYSILLYTTLLYTILLYSSLLTGEEAQEKKGFKFESETDTECIAKMMKHIYSSHENKQVTFQKLAEETIQQLVCFSCCSSPLCSYCVVTV